ncbi:MAG: sigma-54 dependent transcriptional regulator [Acidobacteria bacterium]|nr:sigma-54 dependent transcriptional regulator [Acidobacteriota bacterium]MCA1640938.1 sigma-54 dependent transcriptional regulator [Acidobacteriota bacterium]
MKKIGVLVVDDDPLLRKLVTDQLSRSGFEASSAASGEEALASLQATDYDVVLLDIRMDGMTGLDTLREIRKTDDAPEVIMLTADTSLGTGLEAMRLGAYDYLTKPSTLDEMEAVIRKADEKRRLVRQNANLRAAVRQPQADDTAALVYRSEAMRALVQMAEQAARLDSTVVITGESGTGKDVLASFIHAQSARASEPMIRVNCGALPEQLFESEFFGHEKGAFTGATVLKRGLIEAAEGSTLFLDEIGELPAPMQVKLLHFLENGRFRRVGSTRDRAADVRIIAATNRRLAEDVQQGRFRADLFYRLNVISLHVPPLRERREDIPALIDNFLPLYRERFKRPALSLSDDARRRLSEHDWRGNVRELRNTLERAAALSTSDVIEADQIVGEGGWGLEAGEQTQAVSSDSQPPTPNAYPLRLDDIERQHILRVLEESNGNRERAAAILGISSRTLYRKLREYGAGDDE